MEKETKKLLLQLFFIMTNAFGIVGVIYGIEYDSFWLNMIAGISFALFPVYVIDKLTN